MRPVSSTLKRTRVRQPRPSGAPGTSSMSTGSSVPATRRSCSAHEIGLQSPLGGDLDMLPVTTPAASGPGVGTRRRDAVRGGLDDLDRVGTEVGPGLLGDRRQHHARRGGSGGRRRPGLPRFWPRSRRRRRSGPTSSWSNARSVTDAPCCCKGRGPSLARKWGSGCSIIGRRDRSGIRRVVGCEPARERVMLHHRIEVLLRTRR